MKSQQEQGEDYKASDKKNYIGNFTKENLLKDKEGLADGKKNPLTKKEKHTKEVQSLLLMDSILDQISVFTAKEK